MSKISIIVPVYKVNEEYLENCIKSLINQTFDEIEIILIDDGSPDNCGMICDDYAKVDTRIIVIHQKNQGVSVARNVGISVAKSKWIAFVDSDDWVESNFCEILYNEAERFDTDMLIFNSYINFANKKEKNELYNQPNINLASGEYKQDLELQIINKDSCSYVPVHNELGNPWGIVYKLDFIKNNKLVFVQGLTRGEDQLFTLESIECAEKIIYIDSYLYNYRRNSNSVLNKYTSNLYLICKTYLDKIEEFINKYHKGSIYIDAYNSRVLRTIFTIINGDYLHRDNRKTYSTIKKEINEFLQTAPYKPVLEKINRLKLSAKQKVKLFLIQRPLWILIILKKALVVLKDEKIYE